jgi:hypothetical protein
MILYKNIYMKDNISTQRDDKKYITYIIKNKQWNKFLDVYTLNRILRILSINQAENSEISQYITNIINSIIFSVNRVMVCWTIMSISNLKYGLLTFLLFIPHTKTPLRYLLSLCLFIGLSYITNENILVLVLCEISFPIINSKLLPDIVNDTVIAIKKCMMYFYNIIRTESIMLSFYLCYISYMNYKYIGILTISILNVGVLIRMINYKHDKLNNTSLTIKKKKYIKEDILLLIIEKITTILKTNPLINIFNPFFSTQYKILYKMFLQLYFILIFGYISYYDIKHIILLPFIIQYYLDYMVIS